MTTAAVLLVSVASAGGVGTAVEAQTARAAAPATLCTYRDAFSPAGGTNTGGTPKRYRYPGSPYAGARFDGCTNTLKVFYGGNSSPRYAYYEIRYTYPSRLGWFSWQMRMGPNRVATLRAPAHGDWNFKVRACARTIDGPGPGTCTAWSPQLFLHAV
ncbi:hypothetical protein [Streptomyces sp. OV198]|uniref:hypothetical protein n=1 Tax=Streptomyces sp. OV198 TaxID=1882787 RepID=UPI000BE44CBC|nr:hypothetical protein [Streptomyces sp. OV198]